MAVLNSKKHIFEDIQIKQQTQKTQVALKIISIFEQCLQILNLFSYNNPANQA